MAARIVSFDIESSPSLAWVWKRFKENISLDQVEADGYVLCGAWKWLGERETHCVANTDFDWLNPTDDEKTVRELWKVFDEADIIIAHYGSKFDIPLMNARFVYYGLPPPSPYKVIDTKEIAGKIFKFPSNKLEGLCRFFGLGSKMKTDFQLWKDCMSGKQSAWKKMVSYCKRDVVKLEKVYLKLRPYMHQHPNVALIGELTDKPHCPKCGSTHIQWRGKKVYRTSTQIYSAFQCMKCGGWARGLRSLLSKDSRKNLLAGCGQ